MLASGRVEMTQVVEQQTPCCTGKADKGGVGGDVRVGVAEGNLPQKFAACSSQITLIYFE